jgi:transcriptional regulator with XRE-family HTH domain
MEKLEHKIKRLRDERGLSQEDVGKALGVTRVSVSKWENGQTKDLKLANLVGFCKLFDIGIEEFLSGAFPEIKSLQLTTDVTKVKVPANEVGAVNVAVFSTKKFIGEKELQLYQDTVIGNIGFSEQWVAENLKGITSIKNLWAITGIGDSMSPTYEDGDILIADMGVREVVHSGIYIFNIKNVHFIKRITIMLDGKLEISSDNKNIKTSNIYDDDKSLNILGRIRYIWNGKKL